MVTVHSSHSWNECFRVLAYKYMEHDDNRDTTHIASDITLHFSSDCDVLVSLTY
jgi:hypothetical protein